MTTVFDIYYSNLKSKIPKLNSLSEFNEIEKMLKQMLFELSISGKNELPGLKKQYNECEQLISNIKEQLTLKETKSELDSTLNETTISKHDDLEQNAFIALNQKCKLSSDNETNTMEGKDIALQILDNKDTNLNSINSFIPSNVPLSKYSVQVLLSKMKMMPNKVKGTAITLTLFILLLLCLLKYYL